MWISFPRNARRPGATAWRAILIAAIPGLVMLVGLAVHSASAVAPSELDELALAASSHMYISPTLTVVNSGDSFTVTVMISSTAMMRGAEAGLIFSPTLLEATSWQTGTFFYDWAAAHGATVQLPLPPQIDNVHGSVSLAPVFIQGGPASQGPTGAGPLFIYHLRARPGASGSSALTLNSAGSISDPNGDPLPGLVMAGAQVQVGAAPPPQFGCMYVSPTTTTVKAGDPFSVTIVISSAGMIRGAQAGLIFSPTLLEATGWETGTLLYDWAAAHGASVQLGPPPVIDNVNGTISVTTVSIVGGPGAQGPTGPGSLLIYHLRAKPGASGPSTLTLPSNVSISDVNGDPLPDLVVIGGQVMVTPRFKIYLPLVARSSGP